MLFTNLYYQEPLNDEKLTEENWHMATRGHGGSARVLACKCAVRRNKTVRGSRSFAREDACAPPVSPSPCLSVWFSLHSKPLSLYASRASEFSTQQVSKSFNLPRGRRSLDASLNVSRRFRFACPRA